MSDKIPSLIKWSGSKRLLAHKISSYFPPYKRYIEPFLGGGSILFINTHNSAIANDIYRPLIELWTLIQKDVSKTISSYKLRWNKLQNNLPDYYYYVRERFNKTNDPLDLLFLSRTCVNGIIRFNSAGHFNNSFHLSRTGMTPDNFAPIARSWSDKIKNVKFTNHDYKTILGNLRKGDFVYLDPPYLNSKNRYIENLDFNVFLKQLDRLNIKGIPYALSFDGSRNGKNFNLDFPKDFYKRKILIETGYSPVTKVLNGKNHQVKEALYLNY